MGYFFYLGRIFFINGGLIMSESMTTKLKNILIPIIGSKETEETLQVVEKVRDFINQPIIVDVGAGHGALGYVLAVLIPDVKKVVQIDKITPKSFPLIKEKFNEVFPWTKGLIHRIQGDFNLFKLPKNCFVISCHPCKDLCDLIIDRSMYNRSSFAVIPCCQNPQLLQGQWEQLFSVFTRSQAELIVRFYRIISNPNYIVKIRKIREGITPKNKIIIGITK